MVFWVNLPSSNAGDITLNFPRLVGQIVGHNCDLQRLRVRGWQTLTYTLSAHGQDLSAQKILERHGIRQALASCERHRVPAVLSSEDASGLQH